MRVTRFIFLISSAHSQFANIYQKFDSVISKLNLAMEVFNSKNQPYDNFSDWFDSNFTESLISKRVMSKHDNTENDQTVGGINKHTEEQSHQVKVDFQFQNSKIRIAYLATKNFDKKIHNNTVLLSIMSEYQVFILSGFNEPKPEADLKILKILNGTDFAYKVSPFRGPDSENQVYSIAIYSKILNFERFIEFPSYSNFSYKPVGYMFSWDSSSFSVFPYKSDFDRGPEHVKKEINSISEEFQALRKIDFLPEKSLFIGEFGLDCGENQIDYFGHLSDKEREELTILTNKPKRWFLQTPKYYPRFGERCKTSLALVYRYRRICEDLEVDHRYVKDDLADLTNKSGYKLLGCSID